MTTLAEHARRRPHALAIVDREDRCTYLELYERASRLAALLSSRYHVAGASRVAASLPNSIEHAVLIHALRMLDATVVPINVRLTPTEVHACLRVARPALILGVRSRKPGAGSGHAPPEPLAAFGIQTSDFRLPHSSISSGVRASSPRPAPVHSISPAAIVFTSGSSGDPKPVPLTAANIEAAIAASAGHLGMREDDNWLCPIPLYHVGGLSALLRSAAAGTCVTLFSGGGAGEMLRAFRENGITLASLVPTMLQRLLDGEDAFAAAALPALRAILLGGGPADLRLLDEAAERGLPVLSTYGLTEASSQVATMSLADAAWKRGSAGRPLPGVRISIRNDGGETLPPGAQGSIWISGANVVDGYLDGRLPERFSAGWFDTRDIGCMDGEGFLWIDARREDLILSGGENVTPAEVEQVLRSHPSIIEACVAGVPDAEWGQLVAAAIVVKEPDPAIREIEAHCRRFLAGYKIPKRWKVVAELPKTETGKILRRQIAALLSDSL